jgi:hypothetical protein
VKLPSVDGTARGFVTSISATAGELGLRPDDSIEIRRKFMSLEKSADLTWGPVSSAV